MVQIGVRLGRVGLVGVVLGRAGGLRLAAIVRARFGWVRMGYDRDNARFGYIRLGQLRLGQGRAYIKPRLGGVLSGWDRFD